MSEVLANNTVEVEGRQLEIVTNIANTQVISPDYFSVMRIPLISGRALDERDLNFFFSSGRRNTRFDCDWSSDVCSSDLPASACLPQSTKPREEHMTDTVERKTLTPEHLLDVYRTMRTIREFEERVHAEFATGEIPGFVHRSEERRVGKSVDLGGRRIIKK